MKKWFFILISVLLIFNLSISPVVLADSSLIHFRYQDIPLNKTWVVKFLTPLNASSVSNETIYLTDKKGKNIPSNINYNEETNSISIFPKHLLEPSSIYHITFSEKILSSANIPLKEKTMITFRTTNEFQLKHPSALINKSDLEQARNRITEENWAESYLNYIKKQADQLMASDVTVPAEGAGHSSWYQCSNGSPLTYTKDSNKHYCPSEGKYYTGDKYNAGWRFYRMEELVLGLRNLGNAYVLTNEEEYAEKAKEILLDLSRKYPNYQLQERGGKLFWQSLDEAVAVIDVAFAYDLIYNSKALSSADHLKIKEFLKKSASTIHNNPMGKSNWQAWHNAAIAMVGAAADDQTLINEAIEGPQGAKQLLRKGVLEDGFWWEGSIAYHMYALAAFTVIAEVAENQGTSLYDQDLLKKMYDAPIQYAYPDMTLPSNNNGGIYGHSLIGSSSSRGFYDYEAAYSYYKDPAYRDLLIKKYNKVKRTGDFSLYLGETLNTGGNQLSYASTIFKNLGHGILRAGNSMYTLMDFGAHGGSHGHFDKLHLDIYGANMLLGADPGTPGYTHPLHSKWYQQTISHNLVLVDGRNQNQAEGILKYFLNKPPFNILHASAIDANPGLKYERMVWTDQYYILDRFWVSDPIKAHTFDWMFHSNGEFKSPSPFKVNKLPPSDPFEPFLEKVKSFETYDSWEGSWRQGTGGLKMISLNTGGKTQVIAADSPGDGKNPNLKRSSIIQRKIEKKAEFITIFHPHESASNIDAKLVGTNAIQINIPNESHLLYYNPAPANGEILAAKMISPIYKFKLSDLGEVEVKEDKLFIDQLPSTLHYASFYIKTPLIKEAFINGKKVNFSYENGLTFVKQ
ncbi:alginate lyase family protein [Cytobacillus pseudoceanisediminis]|uniref:alginate lyase family protein n=1 Tax=Cytobacillus pseudoceanisediminis TaxID=3051614 RepID=UPI003C2DE481